MSYSRKGMDKNKLKISNHIIVLINRQPAHRIAVPASRYQHDGPGVFSFEQLLSKSEKIMIAESVNYNNSRMFLENNSLFMTGTNKFY